MSEPVPVSPDVHFDPVAAAAVADECRRTSALLAELTGQRVRLAATAREHWRGRNRQAFDDDLHMITTEVSRISDDLLRAAGDLSQATDAAQLEQRSRDHARPQPQPVSDAVPGVSGRLGAR
jgi:uncharacterized protein YukE